VEGIAVENRVGEIEGIEDGVPEEGDAVFFGFLLFGL
jgi:hypothetical protein